MTHRRSDSSSSVIAPIIWVIGAVFGIGVVGAVFIVVAGMIAWKLMARDNGPPIADANRVRFEPQDLDEFDEFPEKPEPRPIGPPDGPIGPGPIEPGPIGPGPIGPRPIEPGPIGPGPGPIGPGPIGPPTEFPPFPGPGPVRPPIEKPKVVEPPVVIKTPQLPVHTIGAIKPAPLKANKEERMLPSPVADACVGGGGRFYILHLPKERQLAIFDVNEAKFVKYLALADDNIRFAAGMDRLYVVAVDKNIIQRYSLATFEREVTAPFTVNAKFKAIATGAAATGPLLIYCEGRFGSSPVTFVDPATFKELNYQVKGRVDGEHYRASPDGTVFGAWPTSHSQSMTSIVVSGNSAESYRGEMAGSVVPGTDNTLVTSAGLYTPECKQVGTVSENPRYRLRVPSQTGRFYLSCPGGGGAQINTGIGDVGSPVSVFFMGDNRAIATLKDVELPACNEAWASSDYTQDKRVFFVPDAKLIAVIPRSNDRLVLHRFDVDLALQKSGIEFLFVTSRAPSVSFKGTPFTYKPLVRSKNGGVKIKLETGPDGMKVAADGSVNWTVPANFNEAETTVILTVSDGGGQEVFHTFRLAIREKPAAP